MPLNSLSLDLPMRLPIPGDDMLMHSSFSWNWILCRNVPPLFMDVLLLLLLLHFKQASLQWKSKLSPYSFECPRSVLNKGSNCFEIPTWDTHCFTLIKWLLDHSSQHWMPTKPLRVTRRCLWNFHSHKQASIWFFSQTKGGSQQANITQKPQGSFR